MATSHTVYTRFKLALYALLVVDCGWFMREDLVAARQLLVGDFGLAALGATLAQSIDTWAWLGLLALFELETGVLASATLGVRWRALLRLARALCYVGVLYACAGYVLKLGLLQDVEPLPAGTTTCALADGRHAWIRSLDDYPPLDAHNCDSFAAASLLRTSEGGLVGDAAALAAARALALTDVINALAWILVAVVLEVEVWMQLVLHRRHWLHGLPLATKVALYLTLVGAALYWGLAGSFLDTWDAGLWIAAFVFIELNVFRWGGQETAAAATA